MFINLCALSCIYVCRQERSLPTGILPTPNTPLLSLLVGNEYKWRSKYILLFVKLIKNIVFMIHLPSVMFSSNRIMLSIVSAIGFPVRGKKKKSFFN